MKRFFAIAIVIFAVLALLFLVAEAQGWTSEKLYETWLRRARAGGGVWVAGVLIAGLLAADVILPAPSSVLMTLAGALLGPWRGAVVSFAGAMACALLGFGLCRRFGRTRFERVTGATETARVEQMMARYGVWAVLLSRGVPMLTETVSCLAGLSRLHATTFAALAAAGTAPICLVYAWTGHCAGTFTGQGWAVLSTFVLPAVGFALVRLFGGRVSLSVPPTAVRNKAREEPTERETDPGGD